MKPKTIFLLSTLIIVGLMTAGSLNFYPQLSQGDHGRDLYAAQAVLRGELPYKDFWWVYGPLMPYYYALMYKFTGGTIASFLLGQWLIKLACAAFFFLAAAVLMPSLVACLAAVWFAQSQADFFFTFNHIGGIAMELAILYLLFTYINTRHLRLAWATLIPVFIYCLIKINFGLAALVVVLTTIAAVDAVYKNPLTAQKKKFYYCALLAIPAAAGLIYWLLLKDLPGYAIHQCMPYFGDDQPHHRTPFETIPYYFMQHWLTLTHALSGAMAAFSPAPNAPGYVVLLNRLGTSLNLMQHALLHAATLGTLILLFSNKLTDEEKKKLILSVSCLGIFFVLNFHEFVVSGVWYRTFWSLPFLFMFHFIMLATALRFLPRLARGIAWTVFIMLLLFNGIIGFMSIQSQKTPPHLLNGPFAQAYVGNEPQWTDTVNTVSTYLKANLKEDETFFALPYDDIYYYLLNKKSPTRQLIFFDHIHIPKEQEISIIQELESHNVAYVLLSNRIMSSETGLGIFGKTYCPLIAGYIAAKYMPVARQGGNWQAEPGWGDNHGVMIFKRK